MRITEGMSMYEKLNILTDAAKYDVACTSSGVERRGTVLVWEIVKKQEFVIAFLQMEDVFLFLKYYLQMNVFSIASIV